MNRKQIEDYYELTWKDLVLPETIELLSELTCQEYRLKDPMCILEKTKDLKQKKNPLDLGKI